MNNKKPGGLNILKHKIMQTPYLRQYKYKIEEDKINSRM
jgi:hypothetical protein